MKVDSARAQEIAGEKCPAEPRYTQVCMERAIEQAVREQTEWLMQPVCKVCGKAVGWIDDALIRYDCYHEGEKQWEITRAEYLYRKGEKP